MTPPALVASILIPSWNGHHTLPDAIDSAVRQTVRDLEIVVVGDGVTPPTRAVIESAVERDARIRFLDLPKAPGRGERNRHEGVLACRSDLIVYLADDDLLLPWHVENLVQAARSAAFVQSLNSYIDSDDRLRLWPTDLADPQRRAWHLEHPPRNRVSLTGTAHSRALYLDLSPGWVPPPADSWADLTLWQQFFRVPDLRAITVREISALQFPAPLHVGREASEQAERYARWSALTRDPEARRVVARLQQQAEWDELVQFSAESTDRIIMWKETERVLAEAEHGRERERASREHALLTESAARLRVERELDEVRAELAVVRSSTSWRVTAPFRVISSGIRRALSSGRAALRRFTLRR